MAVTVFTGRNSGCLYDDCHSVCTGRDSGCLYDGCHSVYWKGFQDVCMMDVTVFTDEGIQDVCMMTGR